ncbi:MAG: PHP domain-containing protein [Christensenellales bacterium]|jgi:hypothetical protein
MRIELHAHTQEGSPCARVSAAETVAIYRRAGYDALVITNHFDDDLLADFGATDRERVDRYLLGYERALAAAGAGIQVWLGMEVRLNAGVEDYLIYGIDRDFCYRHADLCRLDQRALYDLCRREGARLYQAHPCREPCAPQNPRYLHGYELNQRPGAGNRNGLVAAAFASSPALQAISGSDFHRPQDAAWGGIQVEESLHSGRELADFLARRQPRLIQRGDAP